MMTTLKVFLPAQTKFSSGNADWCRGSPINQELMKHSSQLPVEKKPPETEEECLNYYQERIFSAQKRQLYPLQEDLADWVNKTLGIEYLTGENFFDMLDNGVILCQLARVILERAQYAINKGLYKGVIPEVNVRCFENAAKGSFFSRDNMENFIIFCKQLGVHPNLLFESDDLVLQNQPKNVILCILELSRITTKFNIEPPGLVELEKEIAEEERKIEKYNKIRKIPVSWQFRQSPNTLSRSTSESSSLGETQRCKPLEGSDGVPSDYTEDDWSRGSAEDFYMDIEGGTKEILPNSLNELDRKIQQTAKAVQKHCHCIKGKTNKLSVKKMGEGKYTIAGRNVFIRLLKGRHMMVRVGGGWDTLEHFLMRHDPCQVRIMKRGMSPEIKKTSKYSISNTLGFGSANNIPTGTTPVDANTFLHIRAKYRSPSPI